MAGLVLTNRSAGFLLGLPGDAGHTRAGGYGVDIDVLGPLGVRVNGVAVMPTAPKPRKVLALLALHVDRVLPVDLLIEELWGQRPPRSARTTLQTYILQLRELIGAALQAGAARSAELEPASQDMVSVSVSAKDVLVTAPGGYLLRGGGGASDVQ